MNYILPGASVNVRIIISKKFTPEDAYELKTPKFRMYVVSELLYDDAFGRSYEIGTCQSVLLNDIGAIGATPRSNYTTNPSEGSLAKRPNACPEHNYIEKP